MFLSAVHSNLKPEDQSCKKKKKKSYVNISGDNKDMNFTFHMEPNWYNLLKY